MSSESPPPSYSPPRPPPPYENEMKKEIADNERNEKREGIRVGPAPFVPLSAQPSSFVHPQQAAPNTVIIVHTVKQADTSAPYQTFCPKCQMPITTRQNFVTGTFTWILVLITLVAFFPLAFVPFCLDSCKDVQHFCPKCKTMLSCKRKFF